MNENQGLVIKAIYEALDEVNHMLTKEKQLYKSLETLLIGEQGQLDSLGTINFIVAVESAVQKHFRVSINLVAEIDSPDRHLTSVKSLSDFIARQISL